MVAKRFFYVSAGLLCLALAYQLGAISATAQGPATIEAPEFGQGSGFGGVAFVVGRTFYHGAAEGASMTALGAFVPGDSPVIATRDVGAGPPAVLLASGDIYFYESGAWIHKGNALGGPTSTQRSSFGAVKARYR